MMTWRATSNPAVSDRGCLYGCLHLGLIGILGVIVFMFVSNWQTNRLQRAAAARPSLVDRPAADVNHDHDRDPRLPFLGDLTSARIAVEGDRLLLHRNSRIWLFNISDPTSPSLAATLPLGMKASDLEIQNSHAYIAHDSGHLSIISIDDLTTPSLAGSVLLPGPCRDISISGGLMAAACDTAGVVVYGLSEPTSPSFISTLPAISTEVREDLGTIFNEGNGAAGVAWDESHLYVSDRNLKCFDMSDPTSPRLVGRYDTLTWGRRIVAVNGRVFSLFIFSGPAVFNVMNPAQPKLTSLYMSDSMLPELVPTDFGFILGSVATPGSGIEFVSLAEPGTPRLLHRFKLHSPISNLARRDSLVYYLSDKDKLIILDVAVPESPVVKERISIKTYMNEIRMSLERKKFQPQK